jgi:uncharacterized membrane protein HdeD (DUF308 family)
VTTIRVETYGIVTEEEPPSPLPFWLMLCIGIAWIFLSFLLLQFTYTSVRSLTALVGVVLFVAAASEFGEAFAARSWKWVHALIGVLFAIGGCVAFAYPGQTFGTLAVIFGWYLLIKGTYDIVMAFVLHGLPMWWMRLVAGIAQLALAFWAVGYVGRSAALLVLWVGIGAVIRGVTTLVAAFDIRRESRGAER